MSRWTKRADNPVTIQGVRKLCVPIHQPVHWAFAVVNFTAKTIAYYDSNADDDESSSVHVGHIVLGNIQKYLKDEQADKMQHGAAGRDFDSWARVVLVLRKSRSNLGE